MIRLYWFTQTLHVLDTIEFKMLSWSWPLTVNNNLGNGHDYVHQIHAKCKNKLSLHYQKVNINSWLKTLYIRWNSKIMKIVCQNVTLIWHLCHKMSSKDQIYIIYFKRLNNIFKKTVQWLKCTVEPTNVSLVVLLCFQVLRHYFLYHAPSGGIATDWYRAISLDHRFIVIFIVSWILPKLV